MAASFDLIRAAYHLGNRHVPIELKPDHLKIEPDHVLADMLRAMHLTVRRSTRHSSLRAAPMPAAAMRMVTTTCGHDHSHRTGMAHARDPMPCPP